MPAERQTVREYRAGVWIWNMGHKKILPVCIVWIELASEVSPVIVSLGAMFDAINACQFLDVFLAARPRAGLGQFCARAGKPYGKRLA
jgi:hypothetical protein